MRQHYRKQVLLTDQSEIKRQLEAGTCMRLTRPSEIIKEELQKLYNTDLPPWATPDANLDDNATLLDDESPQPVAPRKANDGPPSVVNTLSLDTSWIISNLVAKYLKPPSTDEGT